MAAGISSVCLYLQVSSATITECHRVGITLLQCVTESSTAGSSCALLALPQWITYWRWLFRVGPLVVKFSLAVCAHMIWSVHTLQHVYKAGGFHYYPLASVSQDCLCPHPISLICSSLSYSSLLLIFSTLYLCYPSVNSPLCLSLSLSLLVSLSLCALWSCLPRLKHCLQSWNITLLCSLFLILQTETLSAELKHHSQSWNITLLVVLSSVQSCPDTHCVTMCHRKHHSR